MPNLLIEHADGVATLTLNRPEALNSFTLALASEMTDALADIAADPATRAVLLTGAGRGFCAGQDLAEAMPKDGIMPDLAEFVRKSWNPVIRAVRKLEKPVVCAVNGVAAGAGANLALACDIVFASTAASFVQSFVKIGVIPDSGGTFILPRIVGLQRASVLAMLGDKITAQQAFEYGMVYTVVEPGALLTDALGCAKHLATQPTRAIGLIKRAFNRSLGVDLDQQLEYEQALQGEAGRSADYAEGVAAFLEKRTAKFTGK